MACIALREYRALYQIIMESPVREFKRNTCPHPGLPHGGDGIFTNRKKPVCMVWFGLVLDDFIVWSCLGGIYVGVFYNPVSYL